MKCMRALLSGLYGERRFINLVIRYDTMSDAIKGYLLYAGLGLANARVPALVTTSLTY